jgi:hydrogenase expression/formation protein HypC
MLPPGGEVEAMCLGVPGQIVETYEKDGLPMARVSFAGIIKEACLAYVPETQVGDYVLVHVGFALSRIDEQEAQEIFTYLEEIGEAEEQAESGERKAEG